MTAFKFPPPPPPPPKAFATDGHDTYTSQRGGYNNGRGGGRSRGWHGRGGGNNGRGGPKGGHGLGPPRGRDDGQARGSSKANHRRGGRDGTQQQAASHPQTSRSNKQPISQSGSLPLNSRPGLYATPAPMNQAQNETQQPANPAVLAQALSFMATPAGQQSMVAFASHMANGGPATLSPQASVPQLFQQPPQESRKRKRPEPPPTPQKVALSRPQLQQNSKPQRVHAATAPSVPSFGFALPTPPPISTVKTPPAQNTSKNRHKVHLGLTQREEVERESDSEEDVDEEAIYAEKGEFTGMVFEYEGQSLSLQSSADLASWIKERKRQFPTQERTAQKAREAAQRREAELDFLAKVKGKRRKPVIDTKSNSTEHASKQCGPHMVDKDAELAKLRKKVQDSVLTKTRPLPTAELSRATLQSVDLGLGYQSESDAELDSFSSLEESSVVSSSSSESSSEKSDSDSDDSNAEPEQQTSKLMPARIRTPPPQPMPAQQRDDLRICEQWQKYGRCRMQEGRRCRFAHPRKEKNEEKRVGLYERMVEQEKHKADRLAIDAIKFLGCNGFLG